MSKVKRVYLGTTLVRPLYKYSYSFMWKTITNLANDGWQATSWWTIDSYWLYRNSWTPMYIQLPFSASTASKITLTSTVRIKKWSGTLDCLVALADSSLGNETWNYVWGLANNWSSMIYAATSTTYTHDYTWVTTWTYVINLDSKTVSISYSDGVSTSPSSASLTDAQVGSIRTCNYLKLMQNWTYDRIQSVWLVVEG